MVQRTEIEMAVPAAAERVGDFRSEVADPQVVEKARRRRFSASYKLKILEEVDRSPGQSGAILRREGFYSSHLGAWRRQGEQGALKTLGKRRGPKGKSAEQVLAERQRVLDAAHAAHPDRFVNGPPKVPSLPQAVWINPPEDKSRSEIRLH